jgi:hypothetical protein
MSTFTHRLENALHEMAALKGFVPTDHETWLIVYKPSAEGIETISAPNPQQAITTYIKQLEKFRQEDPSHFDNLAKYRGTGDGKALLNPNNYTAKKTEPQPGDENLFTRKDIELINKPKTKQTLEAWLNANPQGYTYHIIFGPTGTGSDPQPEPGVITYWKTGNVGGDPLTPYMILHTLGHAVAQQNDPSDRNSDQHNTIMADLLESLNDLAAHANLDYVDNTRLPANQKAKRPAGRDQAYTKFQLARLMHTQAATKTTYPAATNWQGGRIAGYQSLEELIYDLIGIYAKNGKVKIYPRVDEPTPELLQICAKIKYVIETACKEMLDNCVGKVITDN